MQFNLDIGEEAYIEEFACGGGASEGYHLATGRHVNYAVNHDREAVAMHRMNHPHTKHFTQDVWTVDPLYVLSLLNGRKIGGAWYSPDCKHFSKAKGGALVNKRIRGLAWVVKKWWGRGGAIRVAPGKKGRIRRRGPACPRVCFLENVSEFRTWGPLIAKRDPATGRVIKRDGSVAKKGEHVPYRNQYLVPDKKRAGLYYRRLMADAAELGGEWQDRDIRACNYGAPTIRNRLYAICRFDSREIVWPTETHAAPESPAVTETGLKPWRTIAECLDFSLACPSIFLSKTAARVLRIKRPLTTGTLSRLAKGVERFVMKSERPFLINLTHAGGDRTESIDHPAMTITGANRGEKALVAPAFAVHTAHGEADKKGKKRGRSTHSLSESMPTITASNDLALAALHLTRFNTGAIGCDVNSPAPTITANGFIKRPGGAAPLGVVAASIVKLRGDPASHAPSHGMNEPAHTISAGGQHLGLLHANLAELPEGTSKASAVFMAQHNGGLVGHQSYGHSLDEPISTISSKGCQQTVVEAALHIPVLTPDLAVRAREVAKFLRRYGVEFEGEFAMAGEYVIYDIGMRMLVPRELYRAQGFPESYIIDRGMDEIPETGQQVEIRLTKTAQVKMVGNSVSPLVAAAIISANLPEMIMERLAA